MQKKVQYGNESISQLKGADRVRKRPGVIFGSDGLEGCQHSVFEIISNSIDEARSGFGTKIIVTRFLDHSIEVQDFGRGIPVDYNTREGCYNWQLLFCELYAGGKYDTNSGNYEYSLGLNGLGLCATQYASEYMEAEIFTGGFRYFLQFAKGNPVGDMIKEPYSGKQTGTRIKWRPDLEVFTDINIPLEYFQETLKRQSVVNPGITFILKDEISNGKFQTYEYYYKNGIEDYVREIANGQEFSSIQTWQAERIGRDRPDKPEYKVKINVSLCFSNKVKLKEYYHNSSYLEYGGAPEKAVRSALVSKIDGYLKQNGKYTKTDSKISFQDIEDCLILVISSFSTQTSYENQTKKAITNKFIQEAITDFLKHQFDVYFIENPLEAEKICDQVLINMRSRVRAEATRQNLKKTLATGNDLTSRVEKFVDCRSKDVSERELFIVEGDSALGACKQARDSRFQAIIPVRGKILNCLKADYAKIFKNEIITDLIKVLGCGVEVSSKSKELSSFNLDNLRWNKVIICTDADVDGFQIRTLILTMFYRLMPSLINAGKVYIAETPLYEITSGGQTWFAYNEAEKADALKEIGNAKFTIQRSKGLGENDADMMWLTTMNPETRRLIRVEPDSNPAQIEEVFELMLGDNLQGRKDYIAEHGHEYIDLVDVY
ncbi:MAG TPA: toprim domain-containing protein [Clostridiales bacterium]|nr:toprim domain-containing protein [Clostridiales bacterium]HPP67777.1 toprim domain-containing protein [Clostridiales bacterium]HQA05302.1 toprim domain-containing protein [Clostridiales bacterium]HQD73434.1 toprim domain-containing protein [Clostridiales bacterium]